MDKKSRRVEPRNDRLMESSQKDRRPAKKWRDNTKELVKNEEHETTQGSDLEQHKVA